jgi:hypothetical protein
MSPRNLVVTTFSALAVLYALALSFSMFNEYFDGSEPEFGEAIIVKKSTRFMPVPVEVLTLKPQVGDKYKIDVLDELSEKVKIGDLIVVARSSGFLRKQWIQDKDFYLYLSGTRNIQGGVYVLFAVFLSVVWYRLALRTSSHSTYALSSLAIAYAIAYCIFWLLP